jgi:rRNA maturation endonuclease Nob1
MNNKENYIYVCSACNEVVAAKDKICSKCGEDLGQELTEKELEDILQKGPDKAHAFLVAYFEGKDKDAVILLGEKLVKKFPDSKQAKWAAEIIDNAIRLIPRKVKYHEATQKYCSNCKRVGEINRDICQCGYNFKESNIEEIDLLKKLRITKNRKSGIGMILGGIAITILFWNSILSALTDSSTKPVFLMFYYAPFILILLGIYKLITGNAFKSKHTYWSFFSDPETSKNAADDITFVLCHSCKKQILVEMKYKNCPYCKSRLK